MKKLLRHPATLSFLSAILTAYARLVYATCRIQVITPVPAALTQGPVLIALWHQQIAMLPIIHQPSPTKLMALMSGSRDGTFMTMVAARFGIKAAVGSSHRGGIKGAKALVSAGKSGNSLFITPDGPRGPVFVAKAGATEIARLTRLPLVPCAAWSSCGKSFNSWDKLYLPYPFGTIKVAYAEPLQSLTTEALQQQLNTLTAQAKAITAPLASTRSSQ
jgi:lysophospholipid acyltransferase (LPLAT)-like uncharacterized protein